MKIVVQRVKEASVVVEGQVHSSIKHGLCLLVGIEKGDSFEIATRMAEKTISLRIFPDTQEKMNLSLLETDGRVLAVSQFTLAGSTDKGKRPSFDRAEEPQRAERIFEEFIQRMKDITSFKDDRFKHWFQSL